MLCCVLSSGNKAEFPLIDAQLARRKAQHGYIQLAHGGRIYVIEQREAETKLPADVPEGKRKATPFLPVYDDSGHSLYPYSDTWARYASGVGFLPL